MMANGMQWNLLPSTRRNNSNIKLSHGVEKKDSLLHSYATIAHLEKENKKLKEHVTIYKEEKRLIKKKIKSLSAIMCAVNDHFQRMEDKLQRKNQRIIDLSLQLSLLQKQMDQQQIEVRPEDNNKSTMSSSSSLQRSTSSGQALSRLFPPLYSIQPLTIPPSSSPLMHRQRSSRSVVPPMMLAIAATAEAETRDTVADPFMALQREEWSAWTTRLQQVEASLAALQQLQAAATQPPPAATIVQTEEETTMDSLLDEMLQVVQEVDDDDEEEEEEAAIVTPKAATRAPEAPEPDELNEAEEEEENKEQNKYRHTIIAQQQTFTSSATSLLSPHSQRRALYLQQLLARDTMRQQLLASPEAASTATTPILMTKLQVNQTMLDQLYAVLPSLTSPLALAAHTVCPLSDQEAYAAARQQLQQTQGQLQQAAAIIDRSSIMKDQDVKRKVQQWETNLSKQFKLRSSSSLIEEALKSGGRGGGQGEQQGQGSITPASKTSSTASPRASLS